MAITIQQKPYSFTKCSQALIYRATSTNVGNDGFRFVFKIYEDTTLIATLKVAPTPEVTPQGLLNLSPIIRNRIESKISLTSVDLTTNWGNQNYPAYLYKIEVIEGWLSGSVFTEQPASTITEYHYFFKGMYAVSDGFKPSMSRYQMTSDLSLLMGGRKIGTHKPSVVFPSTNLGKSIYIPVRRNNLDMGYLYMLNDRTDTFTDKDSGLDSAYLAKMTLIDSAGASHTASAGIGTIGSNAGMVAIPSYPASLAGTTDFIDPLDYPNYKYYMFEILNLAGTEERSVPYIFYPVDTDCKFDNIRLCWYNEYEGGWDYFNFEKRNEKTINVERKRIQRVVGNYATSMGGFDFDGSERGMMEGMVDVSTTMSISSNILSEGEFLLLSSLIQSKDVYMLKDASTIPIPVIVESNSYTERKLRDGKVYDLNLTIRQSNEYQ